MSGGSIYLSCWLWLYIISRTSFN